MGGGGLFILCFPLMTLREGHSRDFSRSVLSQHGLVFISATMVGLCFYSCIDLVTLSNAQIVGFLPLGLDPLHIRTVFVWVKWVKMGLPGPVGIVSGESLQLPWSPGPAGRWVLALQF